MIKTWFYLFPQSTVIIALTFLIIILSSCKSEQAEIAIETEPEKIEYSKGHIAYTVYAESENPNNVSAFFMFAPSKIDIYFDYPFYRLIETGGFSEGNILVNAETNEAWQIETEDSIVYRGLLSNLDKADSKVKELMPNHFEPTLEFTGNTEIILNYNCSIYKVLRSGFVRDDAETFIHVTKDIIIPPARFDVETEINKVTSPLPLSLGVSNGTILKLVHNSNDMSVSYIATEIHEGKPDSTYFKLPALYVIE